MTPLRRAGVLQGQAQGQASTRPRVIGLNGQEEIGEFFQRLSGVAAPHPTEQGHKRPADPPWVQSPAPNHEGPRSDGGELPASVDKLDQRPHRASDVTQAVREGMGSIDVDQLLSHCPTVGGYDHPCLSGVTPTTYLLPDLSDRRQDGVAPAKEGAQRCSQGHIEGALNIDRDRTGLLDCSGCDHSMTLPAHPGSKQKDRLVQDRDAGTACDVMPVGGPQLFCRTVRFFAVGSVTVTCEKSIDPPRRGVM